jgi:hypothetical protein
VFGKYREAYRLTLLASNVPSPGLKLFLVEELAGGLVAGFDAAEIVQRFLRADQVILGVVIGHFGHAAHRPLGGAQGMAVLLDQRVGDFA